MPCARASRAAWTVPNVERRPRSTSSGDHGSPSARSSRRVSSPRRTRSRYARSWTAASSSHGAASAPHTSPSPSRSTASRRSRYFGSGKRCPRGSGKPWRSCDQNRIPRSMDGGKGSAPETGTIRPMWRGAPQGHDAPMTNSSTIALRTATDRDAGILERLPPLDSPPPPRRRRAAAGPHRRDRVVGRREPPAPQPAPAARRADPPAARRVRGPRAHARERGGKVAPSARCARGARTPAWNRDRHAAERNTPMVVNLFATELARYAGIVGDPAAPAPYWSRGNARDEQPDGGAHGRASAARGRASRRLVRSGFARLRGG